MYRHLVPGFHKEAVNRLSWNANDDHRSNRDAEEVGAGSAAQHVIPCLAPYLWAGVPGEP